MGANLAFRLDNLYNAHKHDAGEKETKRINEFVQESIDILREMQKEKCYVHGKPKIYNEAIGKIISFDSSKSYDDQHNIVKKGLDIASDIATENYWIDTKKYKI